MTLDLWLHFGHILSAIVWVGGGFVLSLVGSRARSSGDASAIREFARTLTYIGPRVMIPAVVGTVVFGVWMVLNGQEWNFGQAWVLIGLVLFAAAFLVGAVYLSRVGIGLQRLAEGAADATADEHRLLDRWILGYRVVLVILVIAVWDMVFKPWS